MERIEAIVRGKVQMVMYRDYACRKGRGLGLTGEARNLPDGTVHIIAEGERASLEKYVEKLKKGSLLSRVDALAVEWKLATGAYRSFAIAYG